MKIHLIAICILLVCFRLNAQDTSVEKSVYGLQIGALGIWGHNESKLTNSIALRSELGIELGYFDNNFSNESGFLGGFSIILEPRWYYNFDRRVSKNKRIDGNSGNFISLRTNYHPDILLFSESDNINLISDITIIPTYGLRRNIGKHFNYEFAFGIGYIHYFEEENTLLEKPDVGVNLHLRIGYKF